jgi:23S rRNA-intervening sequence protein
MEQPQQCWFDYENLEVYREAIAFIARLSVLLKGKARLGEVKEHLDAASTSIAWNIAEGNGKYSLKDRCRFFDAAHGSALECASGPKGNRTRSKEKPTPNVHLASTIALNIPLLFRSCR